MLEMGVLPAVAAASAAIMILYTSAAVSAAFYVFGLTHLPPSPPSFPPLLGPLMLEMGVLPAVAAASTATMILYTSAAASAAFYVFGLIPLDYGALFFVWGFLCTFAGQLVVSHMLRKYKKQSFIVLSIGGVILLSVFLMGGEAVRDYVQDPAKAVRMSSLCE